MEFEEIIANIDERIRIAKIWHDKAVNDCIDCAMTEKTDKYSRSKHQNAIRETYEKAAIWEELEALKRDILEV